MSSAYPLWKQFQTTLAQESTKRDIRLLILGWCAAMALLALLIDNEYGLAALLAYVFLP